MRRAWPPRPPTLPPPPVWPAARASDYARCAPQVSQPGALSLDTLSLDAPSLSALSLAIALTLGLLAHLSLMALAPLAPLAPLSLTSLLLPTTLTTIGAMACEYCGLTFVDLEDNGIGANGAQVLGGRAVHHPDEHQRQVRDQVERRGRRPWTAAALSSPAATQTPPAPGRRLPTARR